MQLYSFLAICLLLLSITVPSYGQTCSKDKSCETPACCSQWGNCGFGPDFCGSSCIRDCDKRPECGQYSLTPECPLKVCCSQYGFCGTTTDFCTQCQSNCNAPAKKTCSANSTFVRVGYYASWARDRSCYPYSAVNINPRSYTHLNYAFGQISGGVMVSPSGQELNEITAFTELKLINPSLKSLISVGGWAFNDPGPSQQEFHNIISTSGSRSTFINSVRSYLDSYNFDGIDIDYEYPTAPDRGGSPEDTINFLQLVKDMRSAFASKYLITIAAPASYWYLKNFAIGEMSKYIDFINIMTYDIHGTWDADIASLGPFVRSHTNIKEIDLALELFLKDGVPPEKLVLGLAYYGRSFQLKNPSCSKIGCEFVGPARAGRCTNSPGTLAWFEINEIKASSGSQSILDSDSMSKILFFDNDQWVAYDDEDTLLLRQEYAGKNCMLGTMIWSIDQGVEQTSGKNSLMRGGSFNFNNVLLFIRLALNQYGQLVETLDITSDFHTTGDEVGATSITISRTTSQMDGKCTATPAITFATPTATQTISTPTGPFWATIQQTVYEDNSLQEAIITDPDDPIEQAIIRNIPGGYRVEYIEAIIFPRHLGLPRTNFDADDNTHMFDVLDARTGDEMGHLVASSLGGRAVWYNLAPQSSFVNRNVGARSVVISWYDAERLAREYLQNERSEGRTGSYVRWRVYLYYEDFTSGRPTRFSLQATMFRYGSEVIGRSVDILDLCNDGPHSLVCPRKKDV